MFCLILVIAYCMSQIYAKKSNIATLPHKNILMNPYRCNRRHHITDASRNSCAISSRNLAASRPAASAKSSSLEA